MLHLLSVLLLSTLLFGCGVKGDLYLPAPEAQATEGCGHFAN